MSTFGPTVVQKRYVTCKNIDLYKISFQRMLLLKQRKSESLENAQNDKIENVKEPVHGRYWNMQCTVHVP
jgi:hypothetical protein